MGIPDYKTPEELQKKFDEYLNFIKENNKNPTICGLALFLGFCSRQSFYDYEKREAFSYTIKKIRMHIEDAYEQQLWNKNSGGAIFALKNFGWKDKTEVVHELPQNLNFSISYRNGD